MSGGISEKGEKRGNEPRLGGGAEAPARDGCWKMSHAIFHAKTEVIEVIPTCHFRVRLHLSSFLDKKIHVHCLLRSFRWWQLGFGEL